jgi:hypothetical protein
MNTCDATTVVVAPAAAPRWQYSAATAVVTPPGAGPEVTLEAARVLLHNPLGPHASPSTVEQ